MTREEHYVDRYVEQDPEGLKPGWDGEPPPCGGAVVAERTRYEDVSHVECVRLADERQALGRIIGGLLSGVAVLDREVGGELAVHPK